LKILKPIRFNGIIEKGGSTRPWKVVLLDGGKAVPYVVKMFSPRTIEQQHATGKEVFGNRLAAEFGLYVPDMALTEFDDQFIEFVLDEEHRTILAKVHTGLKYASKLQDGMVIYSQTLHKRFLKEWDFANVFAFDCLCFNLDRGRREDKPNILVEDDNFLLIDHEQIFPFIDNIDNFYRQIVEAFDKDELVYNYQSHVFYPVLKDLRTDDKKHLFDEFEMMLTNLDVNKMNGLVQNLGALNILVGNSQRLIEYLYLLKTNAKKFTGILLSCIA
jgi:hypothetical protein